MKKTTLKVVRELDGIHPNGTKSRIKILLGDPYLHDHSFRYPIAIEGIHFEHTYPDIRGVDPLQCILLSAELAKGMIEDYLEHGGQLFYPNSSQAYDLKNW